jgi:folate-binding protein YgfZ
MAGVSRAQIVAMTRVVAMSGYQALREHAAWIDLSGRGKIRATGEDRARLLHAMTTQQVEEMKPGDGAYAFFLNAQGRILGDANLFCFEEYFLLDTEPETRQKLFEHLDRYIIADDVALEDLTAEMATIAVEGPQAASVLAKLGAPIPEAPYRTRAWGDRIVARVSSTGSEGFFVFLPARGRPEFTDQLVGVSEASADDARLVRIENGHPRYGEEITERYLVQETGQTHAVNFTKGCYLGQEIVERVRSRAQIHRVLRRLEIDGLEPPAAGTKLTSGGTDAAEIASSAFSPALAKVIALAYVRVQYAEPGTELRLGDSRVRVTA